MSTRRVLLVPVGATEQHGHAGLIGTDAICAEAVARGAGRLLGVPVAPTLAIGMSQFHLGFAGSLTLRPSTLQAVVVDIVRSAAVHGFDRIHFVNGHGGNIGPVGAALQEVHAEDALTGPAGGRPLRLRLRNWWQGPRTTALVAALYGEREGFHGTASEIAIVRHLRPDIARPFAPSAHRSEDGIETDHGGDHYDGPAQFRRSYPDGLVLSDPTLSRPEDGDRILDAAIADIADDVRRFEALAD